MGQGQDPFAQLTPPPQQKPAGADPFAQMEQAAQSKGLIGGTRAMISPAPTYRERFRDALPNVGGMVGGILGEGWASVPMAMAGASLGSMAKDAWRLHDKASNPSLDVPQNMTDAITNAGEESVLSGALPEVGGKAVGAGVRGAGNLIARVGAKARNAKYIDKTINPFGLRATPQEAGKEAQTILRENRESAEGPLRSAYDRLMGGPFGKARAIKVEEEMTPRVNDHSDQVFTIDEVPTTTITEHGPTMSEVHAERSEALKAGRKAGERAGVREAMGTASSKMDQMRGIASDNSMENDMGLYEHLSNAWKNVQQLHGNKMQRQIQNQKGEQVVELLTNPKRWNSFKVSRPSGDRTTLAGADLTRMLKESFSNGGTNITNWPWLQTMVQKRLVEKSQVMGKVDGAKLYQLVDDMVKNGGQDLVPAHKELLEIAKVYGDEKARDGVSTALLLSAISGGLFASGHYAEGGVAGSLATGAKGLSYMMNRTEPDLARAVAQRAGKKGAGERVLALLAKISAQGAIAAGRGDTTTTPIPEPPR